MFKDGRRNYKILRNAFVDHDVRVKSSEEDDKEFDVKIIDAVSENFPEFYVLIKVKND